MFQKAVADLTHKVGEPTQTSTRYSTAEGTGYGSHMHVSPHATVGGQKAARAVELIYTLLPLFEVNSILIIVDW